MKLIDCEQYSPQWWEARKGIPTASNAAKVFTSQAKPSTSQPGYIHNLIAEHYDPQYGFKEDTATAAMKNGRIIEPRARAYYEFDQGLDVRQVGFCLTDDGRLGCSPDALVGDEGGVEIKVPQHNTQIKYLLANKVPAKYIPQIHWSLVVTGREWWDFLSYCYGLPKLLIRVTPDDYTEKMRKQMGVFWKEYQASLQLIRDMTDDRQEAFDKEQEEIATAKMF